MGHSIGRWDGDTLVIDTVGFNNRGWLWNDYPHTDQLHLIERFTRVDLATLKLDVTDDEPGALSSPWELHMTWRLAAEFDSDEPATLTGTVTKIEWINPHAYLYMDVVDKTSGETTSWQMELGSPNGLRRLGWRQATVKEGDELNVEGTLARVKPNLANARSAAPVRTGQRLGASSSEGQR
jgi:hypothetical protein